MTVLQSTMAPAFEHEDAFPVSFAVARSASGYFSLRLRVPRVLLSRLGDPARIRVSGSPHEGYIIEPAPKSATAATYAVNYAASPSSVVVSMAFKPTKLSKVARRAVEVTARVKANRAKVGGMPQEWIRGDRAWTSDAPADNHHRLPARPASGTLTVPTVVEAANGHAAPAGVTSPPPKESRIFSEEDVTVDQLRARIAFTLREAGTLKAELERRTGLKLRISADLRIVVALD